MASLDISNINHFDVIEEEVVTNTVTQNNQDPACFVAVHIGAGFHSLAKTGAYRILCENICKEVVKLLKKGCNARTGVATAVALLEVCQLISNP